MSQLDDIRKPIASELETFETYFKQSVKSKVSLLNIITSYILKSKGKQMRPMFVMFSAALHGDISDKTFRAAAMIELLHTATLVHDDVVDDSDKRRGMFSVNALWKNKAAVLVGDYLLSKGLLQSLENKDFDMLQIVSEAIKMMSEGELLQVEKSRNLKVDESVYYEIIRRKTASLFAACCACGAASVNAPEEVVKQMWLFGEHTGMAFQIKDDLFDYQKNNKSGKPDGIDIRDKKMTLPLIYLLNKSSYMDRRRYVNIVKNKADDAEQITFLINKVIESGGLDYARQVMDEEHNKARAILAAFPENEARTSLEKLLRFTIDRQV